MKNVLLPFVTSTLMALTITPAVRKLSIRVGAVDTPKDDRRIHDKPMPLMGGLAIYIAFIVSALIFLPINKTLISIIIGSTLVLISGIIDDVKELSPKGKLVFQIAAAIILILGDVKIDAITDIFGIQEGNIINLNGLSIVLTIFWVVGITNTINLIDGLDGLAAGVTLIASLSFMFVAGKFNYLMIMILAAIVAGGCLGFLPYNFNPAKIFMGDTGALFLGFILAAISIEGVMKSVATIAVIVPIIILGLPIFDTAFAIFRRVLNGRSIAEADKGHLHHRFLARGYNQKTTVLILYAISGVFGISAILISEANTKRAVFFAMVVMIIVMLLVIKMELGKCKKEDKDED